MCDPCLHIKEVLAGRVLCELGGFVPIYNQVWCHHCVFCG